MGNKRFTALVPADAGREYKAANKYDPEYCWTVRQLAEGGEFPEEWCAAIGVTMPTLFNWANAYPEFEQAMHEAWWLCRAYWTKQARTSVQGVGIPPTVLIKVLESRFPDTWGKTAARNTHETFTNRNEIAEEEERAELSPEALRDVEDDKIAARIQALEARHRARKGG